MTGNERHYTSDPQSESVGVRERETCFKYFQKHNSMYRGLGRKEERTSRSDSRVDGTSRSSCSPRKSDVLMRSIYAYGERGVCVAHRERSGQRNYVTLRKRASIASVSMSAQNGRLIKEKP